MYRSRFVKDLPKVDTSTNMLCAKRQRPGVTWPSHTSSENPCE